MNAGQKRIFQIYFFVAFVWLEWHPAAQLELPSSEIVFWRTLAGSLLLIGIYCFGNRKRLVAATQEALSQHKDLLCVALSGIFMGLSWIHLYEAYALIGVSFSSLAYYCGPVIVMALSPILFHEKLTPGSVAGFVIVFTDVILTNDTVSESIDRIGITCGLASAVAHAMMVIFSQKARRIKGLENAMIQLVLSFLTVMIYIGIKNGFALQAERGDWGWLIVLGLVNTGFGCYMYFSSIGTLSVQSVSVLGYLEPLSAVLLAVILLGERMNALKWLGAMLMIGGALLAECAQNGSINAQSRKRIAGNQK